MHASPFTGVYKFIVNICCMGNLQNVMKSLTTISLFQSVERGLMIGMEIIENSIKSSLTLPLHTLKLHLWMETRCLSVRGSRRKHKHRLDVTPEPTEVGTGENVQKP